VLGTASCGVRPSGWTVPGGFVATMSPSSRTSYRRRGCRRYNNESRLLRCFCLVCTVLGGVQAAMRARRWRLHDFAGGAPVTCNEEGNWIGAVVLSGERTRPRVPFPASRRKDLRRDAPAVVRGCFGCSTEPLWARPLVRMNRAR
jgi:hypothetical protein